MLEEGMVQFNFRAHWNIWSTKPCDETSLWGHTSHSMIMSPKNTESISISRALLSRSSVTRAYPGAGVFRGICLYREHKIWLGQLKWSLCKESRVHNLKIAIGFPYVFPGYIVSPTVSIPFPRRYRTLVKVCKGYEE
jgi:hypothetical protein